MTTEAVTADPAFNASTTLADLATNQSVVLPWPGVPCCGPIGEVWLMPWRLWAATLGVLCIQLLLCVGANSLLITTILLSPSLKTPPNALLVSIGANNLLLGLAIMLSIIDLLTSGAAVPDTRLLVASPATTRALGDVQLFLVVWCLMQYWSIFSGISYYRTKTLRRPSMSPRNRCRIIRSSLILGWVISALFSLFWTLSSRHEISAVTWDPFRACVPNKALLSLARFNFKQTIVLFCIILLFVIGALIIGFSYHLIFKTLYVARPLCHNRVSPWARASSFSSDENDLTFGGRRSYRPMDMSWTKSPFTITSGIIGENIMIHYQNNTETLSFDVRALENPLRAARIPHSHRTLHGTVSNASTTSMKSRVEFSDISPAGELQRVSHFKNTRALRTYSLHRERVSLSAATKNSLVMLLTYFTCSLPMALSSLPGVLGASSVTHVTVPLAFTRLLFYMNAPAYPIWYLVFSRRVRKCLHRLVDRLLIHTHIRK